MSLLPRPEQFGDWKDWASRLVSRLASLVEKADANVIRLPEYTVATLPDVGLGRSCLITVSNEVGGYVVAFSDGTNWRRVTDRAVVA